jgi:hypothetical protein
MPLLGDGVRGDPVETDHLGNEVAPTSSRSYTVTPQHALVVLEQADPVTDFSFIDHLFQSYGSMARHTDSIASKQVMLITVLLHVSRMTATEKLHQKRNCFQNMLLTSTPFDFCFTLSALCMNLGLG